MRPLFFGKEGANILPKIHCKIQISVSELAARIPNGKWNLECFKRGAYTVLRWDDVNKVS